MSRYDLGKDLFNNIEISDEVKKELYVNSKKGKRTSDFRFRYASALSAMMAVVIIGSTGLAVKAGYESVAKRMAEMSEEEREEYTVDIENDNGVTIDDSWSRALTNNEVLRMAELEREYYDSGLFPAEEVGRVEKLSDWDGSSVCYIEEDHQIHLPEAEMTDEQLLVFIDYSAKKDYMIKEGAEAAVTEAAEEDPDFYREEVESPYVDVTEVSEEELISMGYEHLKVFLGGELGSEWSARVEAFMPSAANPEYGTSHDMYTICWEQSGGTPNSKDYVVVLGMHELEFKAVAVRGREHWATLGSYTDEEALDKAEKDKEKVYAVLAEKYGCAEKPDSERVEVWHEYDEYGDARQLRYVFKYGSKTVDVTWDIADERLASVEID